MTDDKLHITISTAEQPSLTRPEYAQLCEVVMNYCTRELGLDKIKALPFVTNIVDELQPVILRHRERWERVALHQPNQLLRSAFQVAQRQGKDTNWEAFTNQLSEELEREHKIMYKGDDNASIT